ncbi:uncharacterized protein EAF01_004808 [Botrytis porri]|uniref:Uncharacterized protein n=1 Tax=Botrytis porri TaxID=87229 RepID=A0A4Z1KUG9_9HELO|nr:uncharacterized protein EAF01_004808 [Botrytis porri]KAF7907221.1 hypothetical protein EAF01_004808 [Botrytis porri]TGO88180.1 hypothetical protein BPOR_0178g00100 [Botrytis porri]
MCQRQWVKFWCGDLRYAEIRCDQNPAGRTFESCVTRQTTELLRDGRGPLGHWDPSLYRCPGRCIDWEKLTGKNSGNVKDVVLDKLAWIPCRGEWHAANADRLSNVAPDLYHDTASRNSKTGSSGRPQKKLKVSAKDIIAKTSDILDCDSSVETLHI